MASRFALTGSRQHEFLESKRCIPEEREGSPSPSQAATPVVYGRESLADRPEDEGCIRSPEPMLVGTPFATSCSRQIPISNFRAVTPQQSLFADTALSKSCASRAERRGIITRLTKLTLGQESSETVPLDMDTEAELEELNGDGPGDTFGLQVFKIAQRYTNIKTLD